MKSIHLTLIFLLLGIWNIQAQQTDILLKASHSNGEMVLKWYPLRPTLWDSLNTIGYHLERYELDENGGVDNNSRTALAGNPLPAIFPKDSLWFVERAGEQDGYLVAIGELLYNPEYQFAENELLDATTVRYNYLVHEIKYSDNIAANALGLFYQDTTMVDGLKYRYVLSAKQNGETILSAQVDMNSESGYWQNEVPDFNLEFEFPGGESLTDMSGRLLEHPLDIVSSIAKPYGDSIVLRWGPNNPEFWSRANKIGYEIMRTEVVQGKETGVQSLGFIRPLEEDQLGEYVADDSMALIAAQVLYGNMATQPQNLYESSSLFENRYGLALYSADRSALAANILGLRYVDTDVEPGKTYMYYIVSPVSNFPMGSEFLEVENVYQPDPAPVGFRYESGDKVVQLSWNKTENELNYSAYNLERSDDDGQTYFQLNKRPILFIEDDEFPLDHFVFHDSVETNYKMYHYRLRGISAFAETSLPAEIQAQAIDLTPPPRVRLTEFRLLDDTTHMLISWKTPKEIPDDFAGYRVLLGQGTLGHFDTLTNLLAADVLSYTYTVEKYSERTHFFKVLSEDVNGNFSSSEAHYVHYPDLVPPDSPTNLQGAADENGIVTLTWDESVADDVRGYYVYSANDPEDTFVPLNGFALKGNTFQDTIALVTMTESIYYMVRAEDESYHKSEITEVIEVARPDNVPPVAPVLKQPIATDSAIILVWTPSISLDVSSYELYKRPARSDEAWELLATFPDELERVYLDKDCEYGKYYEYTVRVKDDADLYSDYAVPLSGKMTYSSDKIKVESLTLNYNEEQKQVQIEWAYNPPEIMPPGASSFEFYLFRSKGGEKVSKFTKTDASTSQYLDTKLSKNALHNYAIMVVYDNGFRGALSEVQSVIVTE